MKMYEEKTLMDFEPWSGAVYTYEKLTYEQLKQLDAIIEDLYPEGVETTQINDILWFETDWIAEMLGFSDWEELEMANEETEAES